uniref:Bromo domain-containing protein n=1 Tax=Anopheles culicifacies TaxID=139723 RepID=A0A182MR42_9DIPT
MHNLFGREMGLELKLLHRKSAQQPLYYHGNGSMLGSQVLAMLDLHRPVQSCGFFLTHRSSAKPSGSYNSQDQYQMHMCPVPPPAMPPLMPPHAYPGMKQGPTMPMLMVPAPMRPVLVYRYPQTYEQMQFNFSYSSHNATAFSSNHGSTHGQSVVSSFEIKMSSSVVNSNPVNMFVPPVEPEVVNRTEPTPSCHYARRSFSPDYLVNQFPELVKMALDGCKKAEALATCHQKRPCFKKIDSLCARLKQDLVKTDNVMSNINSQGLAWAVKDFIFVFTRIMNAWIIIKGYVSTKPEGLLMVQRELCPNFLDAFGHWHVATHELVQSIIKSFINLNKLAKQQRSGGNIFTKTEDQSSKADGDASAGQSPSDLFGDIGETETLNLNNGDYIRAGVYPNVSCPPPGFEQHRKAAADSDLDPERVQSTEWKAVVPPSYSKYSEFQKDTNDKANTPTSESFPFPNDRQSIYSLHRKTSEECIEWVLNGVKGIEEAQYFYTIHFAKNYFPDFDLIASDMIELRTVYKKHMAGQYAMAVELLDDLQQIVNTCKRYVITSCQFELWAPNDAVPSICTPNQCKEWENFPKMQSFIAGMEYLLGYYRKESTIGNDRSPNYGVEDLYGIRSFN